MATFYCVGFPDLANTWARYGHVSNHEIFLTEDEAKKANEGRITCVHEFYVRDSMLVSTIERLNIQRANFLENARSNKNDHRKISRRSRKTTRTVYNWLRDNE